jgi:gamma-glutamylcyclotransferase (GGCT)/AIG2-like uncharacterized protein YtfP
MLSARHKHATHRDGGAGKDTDAKLDVTRLKLFVSTATIMPESTAALAQAVAPRYVFVYGTLRRGEANDITRLRPAPIFVGQTSVAGMMYDLGEYPGVRLGGLGRVVGEVYAISAALEAQLDEIESIYPGQSDEYARREIDVVVGSKKLACLMYEINPDCTVSKAVIAHGDWVLRGTGGPDSLCFHDE